MSGRRLRNLMVALATNVALLGHGAWTVQAQDAAPDGRPLWQQDPYDQITLRDDSVLKTLPLDLPGRRLPENPRGADVLMLRFLDRPAETFELRWRDVAEIKLYEQLLLDEAQRLTSEGQFDEAYDYYAYLNRNHEAFPGVADAIVEYLYEEAKHWQREGEYDRTLGLLNELYVRRPEFAGLDRAFGAVVNQLIEQQVENQEFQAARQLLEGLAKKFPETEVVVRRSAEFSARAAELADQGRAHLEAGRIVDAHDATRRALTVWPSLPAARALFEELNRDFPYVAVGVSELPGATPGNTLDDWSTRRCERLLSRQLFELRGYGEEGGEYDCPLGQFESGDLGLRLSFRLNQGIHWSPTDELLTGYDVSRQLVAMAEPGNEVFERQWAEIFAGVEVRSVYQLDARLQRTHVRPEALLQASILPWNAAPTDGEQPSIGPYRLATRQPSDVQYVLNEDYFARGATQPALLVERQFEDSAAAIRALRLGEISVLDRISPWELARVRALEGVTVRPYAVPLVHCLIPNQQRPLLNNRQFRRALVYAIHRQRILFDELLDGDEQTESRLISGPFPHGYAYNDQVEVRPFEPNLARTLSRIAITQWQKAQSQEGDGQPAGESADAAAAEPPRVKLTLAHPTNYVATVACQSIAAQLEQVLEIDMELVPLTADATEQEYDLRYAELAMWEPVVDARRLLGSDGLTGGSSNFLELALRQLEAANDWKTAREKLLEIHRLADEDTAIVPLWQLNDHFAHRQSLTGFGDPPVQLYEEIERWQTASLAATRSNETERLAGRRSP